MEDESLSELRAKGRQNKMMVDNFNNFKIEDIYEKAASAKIDKKLNTGILYDNRFTLHKCLWDPEYPESAQRYMAIMEKLDAYHLTERCVRIHSREATLNELTSVHEESTVDLLKKICETRDKNKLENYASLYDAVYFNKFTNLSANLAAGSVITLVEAVIEKKVQNGIAIVRPPGHHAMKNNYCGYCFFNNVAIAAKQAIDKMGVKRVLIVDWDVHHGQGTQQMFYDDDRVLYFSIHRYQHGIFWPNLRESDFDYIGTDKGKFYNINFPLNETGCFDVDYLAIFHNILLPVAYEGQMQVSPGCYHHLTKLLMGLANGRIVLALEGGYFHHSLSEAVAQTIKALLDDPAPILERNETPVKPCIMEMIYSVQTVLREHWGCFKHLSVEWDDESEDNRPTQNVCPVYFGEVVDPPYLTRNCYPYNDDYIQKYYQSEIVRLHDAYYQNIILHKVAYVYDDSMLLHTSPSQNSFEIPERLTKTIEVFKDLAILDRMHRLRSRPATDDELSFMHTESYIETIKNIEKCTESELIDKKGWMTVFSNEFTDSSARLSTGCFIELTKYVLEEHYSSGLAVIRPPGHHAESETAMGFCIFNNVSIAAKYSLSRGISRILILDWDIHHGNGIQRAFYDDPHVLYISLHRYDDKKFFPYSDEADITKTGEGDGLGYNINIAWNDGPMGDAEYMSAFHRIILPVTYLYRPEVIFIAAGFDACKGDPLGGYNVSPETFGHFVSLLKPIACGRIILALEGGYNINSVAYSYAMCAKALLNDPLPNLSYKVKDLRPSAIKTLNKVISVHCKKWPVLLKDVKTYLKDEYFPPIMTTDDDGDDDDLDYNYDYNDDENEDDNAENDDESAN